MASIIIAIGAEALALFGVAGIITKATRSHMRKNSVETVEATPALAMAE
ncbi:hypothetical protein [Sciscionella marina]|nr:hypothetical protein [Sciscionella marina]